MKTRLLLTTAAALALSSASALAAGNNYKYEQLSAFGAEGGTVVQVYLADYVAGDTIDYSQVNVYIAQGGVEILHCFGGNSLLGGNYDVISPTGSAKKATGDASGLADLLTLECSVGVLDTLTVQCDWDDQSYQHSVGNTTVIHLGERFSYHSNSYYATVACDVEINGEAYFLASGNLHLNRGN